MGHGRRRVFFAGACLALALVLVGTSDLPAPVMNTHRGVQVAITIIRGSKEGEEFVDEKLGDVGQQIKKKFDLKRVEIFDKINVTSRSGWTWTFFLPEDLKLLVKWRALQQETAHFEVTLLRQKEKIIDADQKIPLNGVGYAVGKYKKDVLIMMMEPTLNPLADD